MMGDDRGSSYQVLELVLVIVILAPFLGEVVVRADQPMEALALLLLTLLMIVVPILLWTRVGLVEGER